MLNRIALGSVAFATIGMASAPTFAAHIDFFDTPFTNANGEAVTLTTDGAGQNDISDQSGIANDSVLGGSRIATLTQDDSDDEAGNTDGITSRVNPNAGDGVGRLTYNAGSGEDGNLTLLYGFDGADGGIVDLISNAEGNPYNGLTFDFLESDTETGVTVEATDSDGGNFSVLQNRDGTGSLTFDYADFDGVNFASIDQLNFEFNPAANGDFTLISVLRNEGTAVIPSPAALPAGIALLGAFAMRRRRNA